MANLQSEFTEFHNKNQIVAFLQTFYRSIIIVLKTKHRIDNVNLRRTDRDDIKASVHKDWRLCFIQIYLSFFR